MNRLVLALVSLSLFASGHAKASLCKTALLDPNTQNLIVEILNARFENQQNSTPRFTLRDEPGLSTAHLPSSDWLDLYQKSRLALSNALSLRVQNMLASNRTTGDNIPDNTTIEALRVRKDFTLACYMLSLGNTVIPINIINPNQSTPGLLILPPSDHSALSYIRNETLYVYSSSVEPKDSMVDEKLQIVFLGAEAAVEKMGKLSIDQLLTN